MIVAIPRRNQSIGDDIEDSLQTPTSSLIAPSTSAGSDSLMTPAWASSASSAPPVTPAQSGSSFDWGSIIKPFTQGLASGIFGSKTPAPRPVPMASSSSGSTALVVGGVALAGVLAVVLLRRSSAA